MHSQIPQSGYSLFSIIHENNFTWGLRHRISPINRLVFSNTFLRLTSEKVRYQRPFKGNTDFLPVWVKMTFIQTHCWNGNQKYSVKSMENWKKRVVVSHKYIRCFHHMFWMLIVPLMWWFALTSFFLRISTSLFTVISSVFHLPH